MTDEAFGALLFAQWPSLRYRAAKVLRGYGDPENLASQAIANAWDAYRRGTYTENGQLRNFLYRIVSRLAIDVIRSERPGQLGSLDAPILGATGIALHETIASDQDVEAEVATHLELTAAFASITRRQRSVLVRVLSGQRQADVALDLGISEVAVSSNIHRARLRARKRAGLPPLKAGHCAARLVA